MTTKEIIDGLRFTVDMFLFDPSTGETYTEPRNDMDKTTIDACKGAIKLLEQEPKTGHWILHKHNGIGHIECSECSRFYLEAHLLTNRYCPNCGCHMVEPQESEDKE